jgi:hypothetical protein
MKVDRNSVNGWEETHGLPHFDIVNIYLTYKERDINFSKPLKNSWNNEPVCSQQLFSYSPVSC